MTGLDYFTFVVIAVLIAAGLYLAFVLGELPGKIAAQRQHPQAEAIRVAGWLGLITLGLLWPFALIWAYTRPGVSAELAALHEAQDGLVERVATLERDREPLRRTGGTDS
jgi:cytochrome c biogenesis protein CcdA